MRDLLIVATTALAVLAGPASGAGDTQVVAKQTMSFSPCKQVIASMKADLAQAPIVIANTGDVVMVKWMTTTDDMLLTCSRPDQKLLLAYENPELNRPSPPNPASAGRSLAAKAPKAAAWKAAAAVARPQGRPRSRG